MHAPLQSTHNATVKRLRLLQAKRGRKEQAGFLAEGLRIIDGFLEGECSLRAIYVRQGEVVPAHWPSEDIVPISAAVADRLSQHKHSSGYLAEFAFADPRPIQWELGGLVLDGVSDPGNAGTLIRTAAAFGMRQVVCVRDTVDLFAPKVIQASVGALARVVTTHLDDAVKHQWQAPLVGLVAHDGLAPEELQSGPVWLVVGSEAHGMDPALADRCDLLLTLPMSGAVESLNAAVAGAIGIYLCARS